MSRINEPQKCIALHLCYIFSTLHHLLNSLTRTATDFNMTHTFISANCYKMQWKRCRLLPAILCLLKISLPTNGSLAATVKPTTVVSNPGAALHASSSSSQAMPSETLNILVYIGFSLGHMFFTSEAAHTHASWNIEDAGCINWWWQFLLVPSTNLF